MKIIAHRGNLKGARPGSENTIEAIYDAFAEGFDVEIDLWGSDGMLFLGHDAPTNRRMMSKFLEDHRDMLWCHAKNLEALTLLADLDGVNYFWHQKDDYTLTSKGYVWAYPRKPGNKHTVVVDKYLMYAELHEKCYGVCTDLPLLLRGDITRADLISGAIG